MEIIKVLELIQTACMEADSPREFSLHLSDDWQQTLFKVNIPGVMKAGSLLRNSQCLEFNMRLYFTGFCLQKGFDKLLLSDWNDYFDFLQFRNEDKNPYSFDFRKGMQSLALKYDLGEIRAESLSLLDVVYASLRFHIRDVIAHNGIVEIYLRDEKSKDTLSFRLLVRGVKKSDVVEQLLRGIKMTTPELRDVIETFKEMEPDNPVFRKII